MPKFSEVFERVFSVFIKDAVVPLIKNGEVTKNMTAEEINSVICGRLEMESAALKVPSEIKEKKSSVKKSDKKYIESPEEFLRLVNENGVALCSYVPGRGDYKDKACGISLSGDFDLDDPKFYHNWRCAGCLDPKTKEPKSGASAKFFGVEGAAAVSKTKNKKGTPNEALTSFLNGKGQTSPSASVGKPFNPDESYGDSLSFNTSLMSKDKEEKSEYRDVLASVNKNGGIPFVFRVPNTTDKSVKPDVTVIGKLQTNCFKDLSEHQNFKDDKYLNKLLPLNSSERKFLESKVDVPGWRNVKYEFYEEDIEEPVKGSPVATQKDNIFDDLGI